MRNALITDSARCDSPRATTAHRLYTNGILDDLKTKEKTSMLSRESRSDCTNTFLVTGTYYLARRCYIVVRVSRIFAEHLHSLNKFEGLSGGLHAMTE